MSVDRHVAVAAAITAIAALAPWGAVGLGPQLIGVALAVLLLGVPHGAYDGWLLAERFGSRRRVAGAAGVYLLAVVAVFIAWSWAPSGALLAFLALSVFHFGRGDTVAAPWRVPRPLGVLARGAWVVLGPLAAGGAELAFVLESILRDAGAAAAMIEGARTAFVPLAILYGGTALVAAVRGDGRERGSVLLEAVALGAVIALAPPLVAFAVYFCLWHSMRHVLSIRQRQVRWADFVRRSAPAVVGTVALAAGAGLLLPQAPAARTLAYDLFVGLATISVPHVVLVDGWWARGVPTPGSKVPAPERRRARTMARPSRIS